MPFAVKDLPFAKDALDGISAQTIETHHDKLYPGYVNKRNEIEAALPNADRSKSAQTYSEYRALKHEETFNADGQILHELYFSHLGGNGAPPTGALAAALDKDFGSFEAFVDRKSTTSELQSRQYLVCRLLLEKKKTSTSDYSSLSQI